MKVTDLKAFIYADDTMTWGDNVKELKIRLAHWERTEELWFADKFGKDSDVKAVEKGRKKQLKNKGKQRKTSQQIHLPQKCGREKQQDRERYK
jgi:hypothetical protein